MSICDLYFFANPFVSYSSCQMSEHKILSFSYLSEDFVFHILYILPKRTRFSGNLKIGTVLQPFLLQKFHEFFVFKILAVKLNYVLLVITKLSHVMFLLLYGHFLVLSTSFIIKIFPVFTYNLPKPFFRIIRVSLSHSKFIIESVWISRSYGQIW